MSFERKVARRGLKELSSLTEDQMRSLKLKQWLTDEEPYQRRALWICEEVFKQASMGGIEARSLFKVVLSVLIGLKRPIQLQLMIHAKTLKLEFSRSALWANLIPVRSDQLNDVNEMMVDEQGRALTLGERRALARRPTVRSIERLLSDQDHVVIKHLLQNPRLTESLILRIVTNQSQSSMTLLMIFDHSVWGKRRDIQRALALNPRSPLAIRCSLAFALNQEDCEHILRENQVPLPLKVSLRKQIASLNIDG